MKYSIEETTLTSIGDALRRRYGEVKEIVVTELETKVSKTSNATGFDSFEGAYDLGGANQIVNVVTINDATKLKVKMGYETGSKTFVYVAIAAGEYTLDNFPNDVEHYGSTTLKEVELEFDNTDTITFLYSHIYSSVDYNHLGYYAEVIGIKEEKVLNTYSPLKMAEAIDAIEGIPEEALVITGDCRYKFSSNGWNWFVEEFGDRIITKDISNAQYMFVDCNKLTEIPFELNFASSNTSISNMFDGCSSIKDIPKINKLTPESTKNLFCNCNMLREIPENIDKTWDWSYIDGLTSGYSGDRGYIFTGCYSLRKFPMEFLNHGNPMSAYSYSIYYYGFQYCYSLDEIIGLPIPHYKATWTSNVFNSAISSCYRLKDFTFRLQEDETPYVVKWKSQTIDFSSIGHASSTSMKNSIINYNSGITADKEVKDDATYQALKNDPDWFASKIEYSRFNHDSAVNTINSLPDTSAYLATAGGTNTLKFKGVAGSLTDGGAINTLTEEEIAVATSKGWTVTLT